MGILIGGPDAWKTFVEPGGILVSLQWVDIPSEIRGEPEQLEPCMVLASANLKMGRPAFVIPLNAAYQYRHPREAAQRVARCAEHIGVTGISGANKVMDAIHNHLDDLVKMPPAPRGHRKALNLGEATLRANGQVIAQHVVTSDGKLH